MIDKNKLAEGAAYRANILLEQLRAKIDNALLDWYPGNTIRVRADSVSPEISKQIISEYSGPRGNWTVTYDAGPDGGMFVFQ